MKTLLGAAAIAAALLGGASMALADEGQGCEIDIKHDIRVSQDLVAVTERAEPLYAIAQRGVLSVRGEPVDLDAEQRALVEEYGGELSALVPQIIELVSSALALAGGSISTAFNEAFGEESTAGDKLAQAMDEARLAFEARARPEEGVYVLAESDDEFGDELEEEIDDLVGEAMSEVMAQIGRAFTSDEGTFVERMEAFGASMEIVGREIEQSSEVVSDWSEEVCTSVERVRVLEQRMREEVPEFEDMGVLLY